MDFLQSNLTELLQLIRGGAASEKIPPVREDPSAPVVDSDLCPSIADPNEDDPLTNQSAPAPARISRSEYTVNLPRLGRSLIVMYSVLFIITK